MAREAIDTRRATPLVAAVSARRRTLRVLELALVALLATTGCASILPSADALASQSTLSCREVVATGSATIQWTGPTDPRDVPSMARWCATVGPVLFQPVAAPTVPASIDGLAIVSWNVHVGSGDVAGLVQRLRRGELTGGDPIGHFVLLLQEAYRRDTAVPAKIPRGLPTPSRIAARTGRGPDVGHIADALGLAVFYVPSMRNGITSVDPEDRGNAIVSTLNLHDPQVIELPLEHQRRAAAVATLEGRTRAGAEWQLRVADVHLDTALALTRHGPFAARRRQVEALAGGLGSSGAMPAIVGGDFNTWWGPTEPALTFLRQAFPQTPPTPALPTWRGPLGLHAQIDYVFLRGAFPFIRVERLPSRFGSDHYPILAIVRF